VVCRCPPEIVSHPYRADRIARGNDDDEERDCVGDNEGDSCPNGDFELSTYGAFNKSAIEHKYRDFGRASAPEEEKFDDESYL
jgi:hypothetical protein